MVLTGCCKYFDCLYFFFLRSQFENFIFEPFNVMLEDFVATFARSELLVILLVKFCSFAHG